MNTLPLATLAYYSTTDGFQFGLIHFRSTSDNNKKVALFIHGNGSANALSDINKINSLANILLEDGIDFIATNNRGSNYIEQHRQRYENEAKKVFTGMTYEHIDDAQYDLAGMIEYAISCGYTDIYLVGFSTGANKIAVYDHYINAKPAELKGYLFVSGGDDIGLRQRLLGHKLSESLHTIRQKVQEGSGSHFVDTDTYPTRHPLSYESLLEMLEDNSDYNVFNYHAAYSERELFPFLKKVVLPSLFIYGSEDDTTFVDVPTAVALLKENLPKKNNDFVVVEGADHNFKGLDASLGRLISDWVRQH